MVWGLHDGVGIHHHLEVIRTDLAVKGALRQTLHHLPGFVEKLDTGSQPSRIDREPQTCGLPAASASETVEAPSAFLPTNTRRGRAAPRP